MNTASFKVRAHRHAPRLLRDIRDGKHIFAHYDQPFGWPMLERLGIARRDGTRATLTILGQIVVEDLFS